MPLNSPIITGDVSGGLHSTSVDKLKGNAVSATAPTTGQTLVWTGSAWAPATPSSGGGGGANGLTYYLRQDVDADAPTTNLPGTPKQLGRTGATGQTTVTSGTLTTGVWTLLGGYVSEAAPIDPNITAIPGGLWDLNLWALGTANQQSPTLIRAKVYTYNGIDAPTLLATSGEQIINTVSAQYSVSVLVPQTTVQLTTRIYIAIEVQASANNHTATLQFGDGTPSHVHTSLPLVGGTGLWKNVAGVLQSPASLLVDADVDAAAAIASSKLATVQVAQGGTGQTTYTNGEILIGNTTGNTLAKATLTAGTNVTITNGPGSITIASTGGSATPTAVQTFINNGTWTKPAGARMVNIQLLGAGGGGGSGRKDTTSGAIRCGGGGGGGGSIVNITVPAAILGATETVTIGTPGIGGAAQVTDLTNGNGGQAGTATSFGSNIIANGGTGGAGGTATAGTGGSGVLQGNNGASASTTGGIGNTGVPSAITSAAQPGGASGASGGGLGVSNTAVAGAGGGRGLIANLAGGLAGAAGGANATNGNANGFAINGLCATGSGGGSGGSSITASGGNGGTGGFPAAGGGGGGACGFSSGFSGAGGSGGAGMAVITTYF